MMNLRRLLALTLSISLVAPAPGAAQFTQAGTVRPVTAMPSSPIAAVSLRANAGTMAAPVALAASVVPSATLSPAASLSAVSVSARAPLSPAALSARSAKSDSAADARMLVEALRSAGVDAAVASDAKTAVADARDGVAKVFEGNPASRWNPANLVAGQAGMLAGATVLAANKGKSGPRSRSRGSDTDVSDLGPLGTPERRDNADNPDSVRDEFDHRGGRDNDHDGSNSSYINGHFIGGVALLIGLGVLAFATGGLATPVAGVQLAGMGPLPLLLGAGMVMGGMIKVPSVPALGGQDQTPLAGPRAPAPGTKTVFVSFAGPKVVRGDVILAREAYENFVPKQQELMAEANAAGLSVNALQGAKATPVASYEVTNTIAFSVQESQAEAFAEAQRAAGHQAVLDEVIVRVPEPIKSNPEDADPNNRGSVSIKENIELANAVRVMKVAEQRFGKPGTRQGFWGRIFNPRETPPDTPFVISDTGADTGHPLIKALRDTVTFYPGDSKGDKNGHGTHTTGTVFSISRWLTNLVHHKIFNDQGGATREAILNHFALMRKEKRVMVSASWGNNFGDPNSIEVKTVVEMAKEGHIFVFAAGNNGRAGKNTVGGPAIAFFKDPATGALRVLAIAATDRGMKVASFSSKGPRSPATKDQADYPSKPDAAFVGVNQESAWPLDMPADRVDGENGPVKAISGTSMATPGFFAGVSLLMTLFGVTEIGPKADAVILAVMSTLKKTGLNDRDNEGEGFLDIEAAYEKLYQQFYPGQTPPTAVMRRQELLTRRAELLRWAGVLRGDGLKDASRYLNEEKEVQAQIQALEAAYPNIVKDTPGFIDQMRGREFKRPVPAHVAEYKAAKAELSRLEDSNPLAAAQGQGRMIRDELIDAYWKDVAPREAALRGRIQQLEARYPELAESRASALLYALAPSYSYGAGMGVFLVVIGLLTGGVLGLAAVTIGAIATAASW